MNRVAKCVVVGLATAAMSWGVLSAQEPAQKQEQPAQKGKAQQEGRPQQGQPGQKGKAQQKGGQPQQQKLSPEETAAAVKAEREKLEQMYADFMQKKKAAGTLTGSYAGFYKSDLDGSVQPYKVTIPEGYDPSKKYPLALNLGGYSPMKNEPAARSGFARGAGPDGAQKNVDEPIISLQPYGRGGTCYIGLSEQDILHTIEIIKSEYSVDPNRVYLTGHSMGGYGTWALGVHYPDMWAGIGPLAGPTDLRELGTGLRGWGPSNGPSPLAYERDGRDEYSPIMIAENMINLPVHIYHGDADGTVPVEHARKMNEALTKLGYTVKYVEIPGGGHLPLNTPELNKEHSGGLEKNYVRNPYPKKVVYKTKNPRYHKAYWTNIEQLGKENEWSLIEAAVKDNGFDVKADNIQRFSITPSAKLLKLDSDVIVTINGKEAYKGKADADKPLAFVNENGAWALAKAAIPAGEKKPGLAGPIEDTFYAPYLLVSGDESTKWGQSAVEKLLQRSSQPPFGSHNELPATTASAVKEADLAVKNLVLIGTPKSNPVIQKVAGKLPVELKDAEFVLGGKNYPYDQYSLLMVAPSSLKKDGYVLVWTGQFAPKSGGEELGMGYVFLPDYVVYDREAGKVVSSGFFDYKWKL